VSRRAALVSFALAVAAAGAPHAARADDGGRVHQGRLLRAGAGVAYLRESWNPSGGAPDAVHTGWGPALEIALGKHLRPGFVLGGSVQLTGIINRDQTTLGMTYPLSRTVHFVDTVSALVDCYPNPRRGLHVGGTLGVAAITELDTYMGGTQTSWGFAGALHGGHGRFVSARSSIGGLVRVAFHRYGTDTPPPAATSNGLFVSALLTFTYD
jgi:hypothetical protein